MKPKKLNPNSNATFQLYDGESIPFEDNSFDRVLAVNTIYFWSNPQKLSREIGRVLKPGGICVLTYGTKGFMHDLPFVGDLFTLYGKEDIRSLAACSNLEVIRFQHNTDIVRPHNLRRETLSRSLRDPWKTVLRRSIEHRSAPNELLRKIPAINGIVSAIYK